VFHHIPAIPRHYQKPTQALLNNGKRLGQIALPTER
jgi:hypothetical protein